MSKPLDYKLNPLSIANSRTEPCLACEHLSHGSAHLYTNRGRTEGNSHPPRHPLHHPPSEEKSINIGVCAPPTRHAPSQSS
ncbi:hypothetical protein AOLI_G00069770 [Acnodon oligacanthus]